MIKKSLLMDLPEIVKEALSAYYRWAEDLGTSNPEIVSYAYTEDARLVPTKSDRIRIGREEIKGYFVEFLDWKPRAHITELKYQIYSENLVEIVGLYEFETVVGILVARYTFMFKKISSDENGEYWLIESHHSSEVVGK